jgi:hypothetical protein
MTIKVAPSSSFEIATDRIVQAWHTAASPKIIRIEGFEGVGKTGLAKLLIERVDGVHVAADQFVSKFDDPPAYRECVRQHELDVAIKNAVKSGRVTILDAVCLEEVAPSERWGRGLVIYVKRLSFNNADPIWHGGLNLEEEAPSNQFHRSIHLYHKGVKPHEKADLIIEMPEEGHCMTNAGYGRDFCLDPSNASVEVHSRMSWFGLRRSYQR